MSTRPDRDRRRVCALAVLSRLSTPLLVAFATACDANPFDPAQQPRVTVTRPAGGPTVLIEWRPDGAQLVRVYRGSVAGDGYSDRLMWSIAANAKNGLASGVPYGATPSGGTTDVAAKPLVTGETYTAQVTRHDPRGSGDGFTNTANRYVGTATFTVTAGGPGTR